MKQQINEIKRMQLIAGLITESEYHESTNEAETSSNLKYTITDEEGDTYLNKEAIKAYLKSVIDPKEIKSVDSFMNDEEGFDESSMHFDIEDNTTEQEIKDWAKQEMSYYLFSKPDAFPSKKMNEAEKMNEAKNINQILTSGGFDSIDDEELLIKVSKILSLIGGNPSAEAVNALVMVIEDAEGGNISWDQ